MRVDADTHLKVKGTDISVRDNAMLADAASKVVTAFVILRDRGLITEEELLRVSYRFAGEIVDVPAILAAAKAAPPPVPPSSAKPPDSIPPGGVPAAANPSNGREK